MFGGGRPIPGGGTAVDITITDGSLSVKHLVQTGSIKLKGVLMMNISGISWLSSCE